MGFDLVVAELMLLGFISLLLTVLQGSMVKICVPEDVMRHLLPCSLPEKSASHDGGAHGTPKSETHSQHRRLLSEESNSGYCSEKVTTLSSLRFNFQFINL